MTHGSLCNQTEWSRKRFERCSIHLHVDNCAKNVLWLQQLFCQVRPMLWKQFEEMRIWPDQCSESFCRTSWQFFEIIDFTPPCQLCRREENECDFLMKRSEEMECQFVLKERAEREKRDTYATLKKRSEEVIIRYKIFLSSRLSIIISSENRLWRFD